MATVNRKTYTVRIHEVEHSGDEAQYWQLLIGMGFVSVRIVERDGDSRLFKFETDKSDAEVQQLLEKEGLA